MQIREDMKTGSRFSTKAGGAVGSNLDKVLLRIESLVSPTSAFAIYSFDFDGVIKDWNQVCEHIYGYSKEEIIGRKVQETILHEAFRETFSDKLDLLRRRNSDCFSEQKLGYKKDGEIVTVNSVMVPVFDGQEATKVISVEVPGEHGQRENSGSQQQDQHYKNILNVIPYGIQEVDLEGKILFANSFLHRLYGFAEGELIGKRVFDLAASDSERQKIKELFGDIKNGEVLNIPYESKRLTMDSRIIDVSVNWGYKRDFSGKIESLICAVTDITRQKKVESALQSSEGLLRNLVANIPGAVYQCAMDSDWTMKFLSKPIEQISGYTAESFILNKVRTYESVIHPDDRKRVAREVEDCVNNNWSYVLEYRIVDSGGRVHWVYDKGQGVKDKNGKVVWLDGVVFDMTDKKKAEDKELRINKLSFF
ncbi:MAG: PAS domain S-box protein [Phycisphaerae bacterium]|nr:PAS domain S-box protein [Phycisphaerae bacterium]